MDKMSGAETKSSDEAREREIIALRLQNELLKSERRLPAP